MPLTPSTLRFLRCGQTLTQHSHPPRSVPYTGGRHSPSDTHRVSITTRPSPPVHHHASLATRLSPRDTQRATPRDTQRATLSEQHSATALSISLQQSPLGGSHFTSFLPCPPTTCSAGVRRSFSDRILAFAPLLPVLRPPRMLQSGAASGLPTIPSFETMR